METMNDPAAWARVEELELVYRTRMRPSERPQITTSRDAWKIFLSIWDMGRIDFQEEFKVMMLNSACRVLGIYNLSSGGIAGTLVDPKLVFCAALKAGAAGIILCHNHPSGRLLPSREDKSLTAKLKAGGELLDIHVYDHLVISPDGYLSFVDEGLL